VHSVNWRGIGMSIANALTFGLAGKFANAIANLKNSVPSANVGMNSARGGLAGARASGGPVVRGRTYLVGERGRELFTPDSSGRIIPNHHIAAMAGGPRHVRPGRGATGPLVGELHIHGAHDPHAVALEVRRQLNALANEQAAVLSD
jgi:hypothetical protein